MTEDNRIKLEKKMAVLDPKLNTLSTMRLVDDQMLQEEADKIKGFLAGHVEKINARLDYLVQNPQQKGAKTKKEDASFSF